MTAGCCQHSFGPIIHSEAFQGNADKWEWKKERWRWIGVMQMPDGASVRAPKFDTQGSFRDTCNAFNGFKKCQKLCVCARAFFLRRCLIIRSVSWNTGRSNKWIFVPRKMTVTCRFAWVQLTIEQQSSTSRMSTNQCYAAHINVKITSHHQIFLLVFGFNFCNSMV